MTVPGGSSEAWPEDTGVRAVPRPRGGLAGIRYPDFLG